MAGDWLKFEANTPEKQEVLAITIALGFDDPDLTVGKLLKVWRWFDQHTVDGNAANVTSALLDRLIGVTGITKAMESVGWMIITEHGLTLPNFDRHNGKTAKQRALTARRVANHKAFSDGNDDSVSESLPREEKRREDKEVKPEPKPKPASAGTVSLKTYLENCKADGIEPIPAEDKVFDFAEDTGLPIEWVHLCWSEFKEKHLESGKRQANWRQTFRNCVRANWYKIWFKDSSGATVLTSQGRLLEQAHRAKDVRAQQ